MKTCSTCKQLLPDTDFHWKRKSHNQRSGKCKACSREYKLAYYEANKEKIKSQVVNYKISRGGGRSVKYNITAEQIQEMLDVHAGLCWLCRSSPATVIDHDHSCCPYAGSCGNCVRGVLCQRCNVGLGYYESFDLEQVKNYLAR